MGWGTAAWLLLRDELLELVEAVRPTIPMKRATFRRLERTLGVDNFRRLAEIHRFDVVRIWILIHERKGEATGGSTSRNSPMR